MGLSRTPSGFATPGAGGVRVEFFDLLACHLPVMRNVFLNGLPGGFVRTVADGFDQFEVIAWTRQIGRAHV